MQMKQHDAHDGQNEKSRTPAVCAIWRHRVVKVPRVRHCCGIEHFNFLFDQSVRICACVRVTQATAAYLLFALVLSQGKLTRTES